MPFENIGVLVITIYKMLVGDIARFLVRRSYTPALHLLYACFTPALHLLYLACLHLVGDIARFLVRYSRLTNLLCSCFTPASHLPLRLARLHLC